MNEDRKEKQTSDWYTHKWKVDGEREILTKKRNQLI